MKLEDIRYDNSVFEGFCCIINTILSLGMPKFTNDRTSTAIFIAHKAH